MARRLRFPMFLKFLVGCLTLAALLIAGGIFVVRSETRMTSRGNYLEKHFKRYLEYQAGLGQASASVADLVVDHDGLQRALADVVLAPPPGAEVPPGATPPATSLATAAALAQRQFKAMGGQNGLRPDLMVVFTSTGQLVWSSPDSIIKGDDLRELDCVARVRAGNAYFNKILVHRGRALQIAGVPIKAPGEDRVVGGVVVGVGLERFLKQFKEQSDPVAKMQYRMTIVREGEVVASTEPKDTWAELAGAVRPEARGKVQEGDLVRDVIKLKEGLFDFYVAPVEGFAGVTAGPVGDLYLMRSRANLVGRGSRVPWTEMVIGIILSLAIASLLAIWTTWPIKSFVRQSAKILEGETDLRARIELRSRDETQDLADNINRVFARLYELARDVQNAAFHVGASSAEISAASKQMLEGLKDQTLKIEGSTAAITELSASIQQVASNAGEATKVAEKSNVAVTSAVIRMEQIRSAVEEAAEKMQELGESGKRIGNIVEVIRQISEQTSLLALNASIEAAHAGEQGRGFAVVADEVSSLARRVGQSAKDIEVLIQTIKEQTAEAVHSMQVGTREVEGGTELVTTTLKDLGQLIAVVKDTAVAVQEQAVVSDEIARSMDAVQKIAAEMLTGSEEAVAQGEQLHGLAFQLEESVGGFNLDGGDGKGGQAATAMRSPATPGRPALTGRTGPARPSADKKAS